MKKKIFGTTTVLLGMLMLMQTNPKYKAPYVDSVVHNLQNLCCRASLTSIVEPCERLWPLTTPVLKGVLYLYTKTPRNYILFTWYTTQLPGYVVHGVGIGGQFWVWAQPSNVNDACVALYAGEIFELNEQLTHLR